MSSRIEDLLLYDPLVNEAAKLGQFDKNFVESFQLRMETKFNVTCDQIQVQFYFREKSKQYQTYYSNMTRYFGEDPVLCRFTPSKDPLYQEFI
jgi:hypothetical protein